MIALSYNEAKKLTEKLGMCFDGSNDGKTYYATNDNYTEIWEFDTKAERDKKCKK